MKEIQLSKGMKVLIDNQDYDRVANFSWHYSISKNGGYAKRKDENNKVVCMSRFILNITDPNLIVDHINGNTLDNRRSNLRVVSKQKNTSHRVNQNCNNTSGYRCVYLDKRRNHWIACIKVNFKKVYLGSYSSPKEAALVVDEALKKYFGENCGKLNFS